MQGDVARAKKLLDAGLDPNTESMYEVRALTLASSLDDPSMVRLLLEYGARVDGKPGELALDGAARRGSAESVRLLLNAGADPNSRYYFGGTALMSAVAASRTEVVETLLEYGADPNLRGRYPDPPRNPGPNWYRHGNREKRCEATPLMLAAKSGNVAIATLLLSYGANSAYTDSYGCTAVDAATAANHLDMVDLIRDYK
jgi:ankyrin repeat protein